MKILYTARERNRIIYHRIYLHISISKKMKLEWSLSLEWSERPQKYIYPHTYEMTSKKKSENKYNIWFMRDLFYLLCCISYTYYLVWSSRAPLGIVLLWWWWCVVCFKKVAFNLLIKKNINIIKSVFFPYIFFFLKTNEYFKNKNGVI